MLDRLLTASGPWGGLTYEYDVIGNRTSSVVNGTTTTYSYSATTNRLLSAITGQQYRGFLHDDNGRLTQDDVVNTYTYTPANLVETAQTWAGALTTYRYDADGQRVLKVQSRRARRTWSTN